MKKTVQCVVVILCIMCALGFVGCKQTEVNNLVGIYDTASFKAFIEGNESKGIVLNNFVCAAYFHFNNTIDKTIDLDGKTITCMDSFEITDYSNLGYKNVTFCDSTKGKGYLVQIGVVSKMFNVSNSRTLSVLDGIHIDVVSPLKEYSAFVVDNGAVLDVIDAVVNINDWGAKLDNEKIYIFEITNGKVNKICGTYGIGTNMCKGVRGIYLKAGSIGEINAEVSTSNSGSGHITKVIETEAGTTISNIKGGPYKSECWSGNISGIDAKGTIANIGETGAKVTIQAFGGGTASNSIAGKSSSSYTNATFDPTF